MVSTMTDSSELQRMARLVDINRQHLEEINQQIESIEAVQLEHADAKKALEELGFHTETLDILGVYESSAFRQK